MLKESAIFFCCLFLIIMTCSFSVTTSNDSFILPSSYWLVKHVIRSTNCSASEIDFIAKESSFLETKVTGKRINRGGGYGLEVPSKYRISGQEKAVDWKKRKAIRFLQEQSLTVNKCIGKKYK